MITSKLRIVTHGLLRNRPTHMRLIDIAEATSLPTPWIKSFLKNGDERDSGSDRVVTLYEFLTRKNIKL